MELPNRKKNRLENYDYSRNGAYFITICTKKKKEILGSIEEDIILQNNIVLSEYGMIVKNTIELISEYYC